MASLEGVDPNSTLREQLEQHMSDPACNSCHVMMDPLGFPLEHFDALGVHRETDNGFPVDASGDLDGFAVDGAAELGAAIAEHHRFSYCVSAQLMRHAIGTLEAVAKNPMRSSFRAILLPLAISLKRAGGVLDSGPVFRGTTGAYNGNECSIEGDVEPATRPVVKGLKPV